MIIYHNIFPSCNFVSLSIDSALLLLYAVTRRMNIILVYYISKNWSRPWYCLPANCATSHVRVELNIAIVSELWFLSRLFFFLFIECIEMPIDHRRIKFNNDKILIITREKILFTFPRIQYMHQFNSILWLFVEFENCSQIAFQQSLVLYRWPHLFR